VTGTVRPPASIGLASRAFMAPVLAPERPIHDWLCELGDWTRNWPGFFAHRPVILDFAAVTLSERAVAHVIAELSQRGVTVMAIEGVDASLDSPKLPPVLSIRRAAGDETPDPSHPAAPDIVPEPEPEPKPASLFVDRPVRSGQSVIFPEGDVTVFGSVGSGAEVLAGGSIHVYGTLRGRAAAGFKGNRGARIFCSRNEAEILSIDGRFRTADTIDGLRGRAVQAWLDGDELRVAALE
jgi:septum site-determining protein MinC